MKATVGVLECQAPRFSVCGRFSDLDGTMFAAQKASHCDYEAQDSQCIRDLAQTVGGRMDENQTLDMNILSLSLANRADFVI